MEVLSQAPHGDEIPVLYSVISQQPDFLEAADEKQFSETPLHLAARQGRTVLALELLRLMPSFGRKLNPDGLSPLDLALQGAHNETARAMAKQDPELVAVQGREGMTPLHYAAGSDDVDKLAYFLKIFPESIDKRTVRRETVVHVAVKNSKLAAFKVLLGWLMRNDRQEVLRWKDWEGNNVLHLAAATNQPEVLELLVKELFSMNKKNSKGQTALDIVTELPNAVNGRALQILRCNGAKKGPSIHNQKSSAEILSSKRTIRDVIRTQRRMYKTVTSNDRKTVLVVACLLVAATYQAIINPPDRSSDQTPFMLNITSILPGSSSNITSIFVATSSNNTSISAGSSTNITSSRVFTNTGSSQGAEEHDMAQTYYRFFIYFNSILFFLGVGTIDLLLPLPREYSIVHASSSLLVLSYMFGSRVPISGVFFFIIYPGFALYRLQRLMIVIAWKHRVLPFFQRGLEVIRWLVDLVTVLQYVVRGLF